MTGVAVVPTTEEDISDSFDVDVLEDTDLGVLPDTQKLVTFLLDAAAATSTKNHHDNKDADDDNEDVEDHDDYDKGAHDETYFNERKWLEKNSPPVIDLTMLRGSDFSDNEKENDVPISLTIKVKVEAMEEEETQWTALIA